MYIEKKKKKAVILIILSLLYITTTGIAFGKTEQEKVNYDINSIQILDLKTAGLISLEQNHSFAATLIRIKQAKELIKQTESAYKPSIDVSASGTKTTLRAEMPPGVDNCYKNYKMGVSLTYLLFDGFERKYQREAAIYGEQVSAASRINSKRLLLSSVASSYFSAQLANENIAIAKADKYFYEQKLKDAKAKREIGTGSLSDELNFQIRVNTAKADLIRIENNYKTAMIGLASLLGIENGEFPENLHLGTLKRESQTEMAKPELENLCSYSKNHRPDIAQSNINIQK